MNYYPTRVWMWGSGITITILVILLLHGFAALRVLFVSEQASFSEAPSSWNFVVINFLMWAAGTLIVLIYKPLKSLTDQQEKFNLIQKQLSEIDTELQTIRLRLEAIPRDQIQELVDIEQLKFMAKHYENILSLIHI